MSMLPTTLKACSTSPRVAKTSRWWLHPARRVVESRLRSLRGGEVRIHTHDGTIDFGAADAGAIEPPLHAKVQVYDDRFWRKAALEGSLGVAEAYLDGWWTCDDLTTLLRIFVRDMSLADRFDRGGARLKSVAARLMHAVRRNSQAGSRRNIQEHYDLGNDFFALWLDDSMTYSCACFDSPAMSLAEAQTAKLDRLCRMVELQAVDHLLEIGTGWGSLAMHAARMYGCRVTTTTISRQQFELATQRVRDAGLDDRVTVLLRDYRELTGCFDKIISIEMIEAVGHAYLPEYFRACASLLKPDGRMALQAITMPDGRYEAYRRHPDFIQRHVFPGSCCPSIAAMTSAMTKSSDLRVHSMASLGPQYATTLRLWREAFLTKIEEVRHLGHSERFIRLWTYYLCYCEAGFAEHYIDNVQMVLTRSASSRSAESSR